MARVSQAHLDARRRQILQGAARCFARDGFHRTSMQDVLTETGLSAGAVYRYFPSKEAIIAAIAEEVLRSVHSAFEEAARQTLPAPPHEIAAGTLDRVASLLDYPPQMVLQMWTEGLRTDALGALFRSHLRQVIGAWTRIVLAYQRAGRMPADVPPEHIARTLMACCQGFLVQCALDPPLETEVLREGLRGLTGGPPSW